VYFAGYTAAVPVLASLTDRVDARRVYLAGAGAAAVAGLGFAVLAQGFWTALLFRALAGFGLAGTFIPGLKALVDRVEPGAQPRAVSFYTAVFGLGTSLAFFAAGEVGWLAGWRWAFAVAALGAAVALALVMFLVQPVAPARSRTADRLLDFRPVLRNRRAMPFILAYACHTWELFSFRSWSVAFLAYSASLYPAGAGAWTPSLVAAVAGLAATGANLLGAELATRLGRTRIITAILWTSALAGALLGFGAALPYPLVAGLTVVYALLVQGDSAALHTGTVGRADPARRGTTMALQSVVGFGTASLGHLAVGVALDATGGASPASWGAAFCVMSGITLLGPWFLRRRPADGA